MAPSGLLLPGSTAAVQLPVHPGSAPLVQALAVPAMLRPRLLEKEAQMHKRSSTWLTPLSWLRCHV